MEHILQKQEREEQDKRQKEEQKIIKRESVNILFQNVTTQKNLANQIQQSVTNAFSEAENDLDTRKNR